jgi:type II secretory pathway pseudopilin PulG
VVVIIGILAAIAIPKFAATKDKAKLASVKSDLRNVETAQEAYFSDNSSYGTGAQLIAANLFNASAGNTATITGSAGGYTATITNSSISSGNKTCTVKNGTDAPAASDSAGVIICTP